MSVTELGYAVIGVKDLSAWRTFLADFIGAEIVEGDRTGQLFARLDYWHHRLELIEDGSDDLIALGWRVAGAEAFEQMHEKLERAGITVEVASEVDADARHVLALMRFVDPDGAQMEVFHGPHIERGLPLRPGRRLHGKFVTDGQGFGHAVLASPDLDAIARFYRVLGLQGSIELRRPTPKGMFDVTFLHCNSREHSLAFAPYDNGVRMGHFMTEYERMEDVGAAYQLARERGIPVKRDIGQHHNDSAFSFYVETPSGWYWEVASGSLPSTGQTEWGRLELWGHAALP